MSGRVASPSFIGRVEELQILMAAEKRAVEGEPAVVLVGGEAGIGKTRLIAELTARCATEGIRVLAGGCVPVGGDGLPYAPIVQALRPLPEELGLHGARELAGPSWRVLARLWPALGDTDAASAGPAAQGRLFELLLGLLGRLSDRAPTLVVIEDLHWADQSTRDLLGFLVRNLRRERLLLVVTYRSDEPSQERLGLYLAELDRGGPIDRIELARFGWGEVVAQLAGILGAAPDASLTEAIFARSEGNPFFTEELLGAVRADSGELPATVRDLLEGRIKKLPDPTQQVLRAAAVAGRRAPHRLLAAVAGLEQRELIGALRTAVSCKQLVVRPGEAGYEFRHALLREVVDADLLPDERARLHADYARALTDRPELAGAAPAALASELAVHWDAAGEFAQALPARVQASLAAERVHAFAEAAHHYERALELWDQMPDPGRPEGLDRVDLLARTADAVALAGEVQRAVGVAEDALGRLNAAVEPVRAAVLLARLGDYRLRTGEEAGALAAFEQAERLLIEAPPSAERARVLAAHASALDLTLRPEEAVPRCEEAIAVARAVGARAEEAKALRVLAGCPRNPDDLDRGIDLGLKARRIAEDVGDVETIVGTYMAVTFVLRLAGRERDALEEGQQGHQRARELGLERALGSRLASTLAFSYLTTGRWIECERLARELLVGDVWDSSGPHLALGLLYTRRGEFSEAREQLDLALRLSAPVDKDLAWLALAQLALWEGRHDEAEAAVVEGLHWWTERDPEEAFRNLSSHWYPLLLQLEADRAEQAAARRAPEKVAAAQHRAAPVLTALDRLAAPAQAQYPWVTSQLMLAHAERSRLEGRSDPQRWQAAAETWERMERPFDAAYARFRQAEALLATGAPRAMSEQALRSAHRTAVTLGAGPLQQEVELLAQRGRLRLQEPAGATAVPETPPSASTSLGLTRRETEVLALVTAGLTNRQIGQALFITPRTVSVHVSRILAKLGVARRGEAAAIAHRLGLDKQ
jgi:DNA-binding CsgD family transcriptional regulator/tetratricopeptide (TPR) repeat protein